MAVTVALIALLAALGAAIKINCGGPAVGGYLADSSVYYGATTSSVRSFPNSNTGGSIYATHAWTFQTSLVYEVPATPGASVQVTAKFAENYSGNRRKGARVLKVYFGNSLVADNLDVFAVAGFNSPHNVVKTVKVPGNGKVVVRVDATAENPMISGIDVVEPVTVDPIANPTPESVGGTAPTLKGSGKWRTAVPASGTPEKRHEACAVMVKGLVYLIGGRGRKPTSVYDPVKKTWTNKATPPVELNHMQCVAWQNRYVYVVGAWFGSFPRESAHDKTYVYDTVADKWTDEPGLPKDRRRGGGALVLHNNKLYLGMGNVGGHGAHATSVGWLDVFDMVKKDEWKKLDDAPDPRDHVGGAVVGGGKYFCIGGGRDGGVANFWGTPITRLNCYNFGSGKWERKATMPDGRAGAATGATCQGLLMIAGGEGRPAGTSGGGKAYTRVDLYDVNTNTFKEPVMLNRGRHGSGLAVADCKCGNIYLPSGSGGLGGGPELTSTEVWSPDGVVRDC